MPIRHTPFFTDQTNWLRSGVDSEKSKDAQSIPWILSGNYTRSKKIIAYLIKPYVMLSVIFTRINSPGGYGNGFRWVMFKHIWVNDAFSIFSEYCHQMNATGPHWWFIISQQCWPHSMPQSVNQFRVMEKVQEWLYKISMIIVLFYGCGIDLRPCHPL